LRTGSISDTIKYDFPITALQFDNRKIVSAAGENGVKVCTYSLLYSRRCQLTLVEFAGLQPDDIGTFDFDDEWSHCTCRKVEIHG